MMGSEEGRASGLRQQVLDTTRLLLEAVDKLEVYVQREYGVVHYRSR